MGGYIGPDLGYQLVGTMLEQKLIEGNIRFKVGVLFRPDRGAKNNLETVLILQDYIPEMWDYSEHWEQAFA